MYFGEIGIIGRVVWVNYGWRDVGIDGVDWRIDGVVRERWCIWDDGGYGIFWWGNGEGIGLIVRIV